MRVACFVLFLSLVLPAYAGTRPAADYTVSLRIVGTMAEGLSVPCGKRIVAEVDGQFVLLTGCNDPLATPLGTYKARLIKDDTSRGLDLDRRYGVLLPNGGEYTLYVSGLCEKQATVCFGFSVGPAK